VVGRPFPQSIDQHDVMMVELVVARQVDHGAVREPVFRPAQTLPTHTDIPRQDYDACIGVRWLEALELICRSISI